MARDAQRLREARALAGEGVAGSRQLGAFVLDGTRRADVAHWQRQRGVACAPGLTPADLQCKLTSLAEFDGPTAQGGTVHFAFDRHGRLKHLWVQGVYADAQAAAADFEQLQARTTAALGARPRLSGAVDAVYLAAAPLRQAAAEYRFADVYARLSATRVGGAHDFVVTQTWRALTD